MRHSIPAPTRPCCTRGRVGVRRPRRPGRGCFSWDDDPAPKGRVMASTWHGEFPVAGPQDRPVAPHLPGQGLSPRTGSGCTTWPATSGSGPAATSPPSPPGASSRMLRGPEPAGHLGRGQPDSRPARGAHPAPRAQGRLPPVRPELLPPLPPGRAPGRSCRHLHRAHRVPLHRAARRIPSARRHEKTGCRTSGAPTRCSAWARASPAYLPLHLLLRRQQKRPVRDRIPAV